MRLEKKSPCKVNLLLNREKREEEAVLRRLTDLVRDALEDLRQTLATLAELDAIAAKVGFARDFTAREPIWRSRGGLDLRLARHALLVQRHRENRAAPEVVPIDLQLTPEKRWLIISGANAGGKTVALKTLGLLTLMVQSGIPIPVAEGSEFCPFEHVFADIGDPQDLHQNLSTFSAHLQKALGMLNTMTGRDLILLDELGTATDPTEGGALALALLQVFYQRGAYGAATTHIPLLKGFAQRTEGFENVAVVFNEETRRPSYRLAYGVVGASNALKIARELGLSPEILAQALDPDPLDPRERKIIRARHLRELDHRAKLRGRPHLARLIFHAAEHLHPLGAQRRDGPADVLDAEPLDEQVRRKVAADGDHRLAELPQRQRAADGHRNLRLVNRGQHGLHLGGADGPQDHRDLFVLQKLLQGRHPTGVGGLVVFEHDLDLPTVDPACGVDLIHPQLEAIALTGRFDVE